MKIEVDFAGSALELSKPLDGNYTWDEAKEIKIEGWRLPTIEELKNLWKEALKAGFRRFNPDPCWSSSPAADHSYFVWLLYFYDGNEYLPDSRGSSYRVRLVKEV